MIWRVLFFSYLSLFLSTAVFATDFLKLPYTAGVSMLLSRGYETHATHVNKDKYALDFVQGECKSFGTPVRAIRSGVVSFVNTRDTWGGGYGKNIILNHGQEYVSRYAHLHEYASGIEAGKKVLQGEIIGYQGNTGNVIGKACKEHPGTHLHFSALQHNEAIKPEPMSGYETFVTGNWYVSDNIFGFHTTTTTDMRGKFITSEMVLSVPYAATEIPVRVAIKNIGAVDWQASSVSLNIVGGVAQRAEGGFHPTWKTVLRPAVIAKKVPAQSVVEIPFVLSVPEQIIDQKIRFQLVSFDGEKFLRIDSGFLSVRLLRDAPLINTSESPFTSLNQSALAELTHESQESLYIPEVKSGGVGSFGSSFVEAAQATIAQVVNTAQTVIGTISNTVSTMVKAEEGTVVATSTEAVLVATATTNTLAVTSTMIYTEVFVSTTTAVMSTSTPDIQNSHEVVMTSSTKEQAVSIDIQVTSSVKEVIEQQIVSSTEKINIICGNQEKEIIIPSTSYINTLLKENQEKIILTKEGSPYVFVGETTIKKNQTLVIEPGVMIVGANPQSFFTVVGSLIAKGTEPTIIRFTSACETDGIGAKAGDWSGIRIVAGGMVDMTYASISYAGAPFIISAGALASSDKVSRVFFNQGGTLNLNRTVIEKNFVISPNQQLNSLIWTEHGEATEGVFISEYNLYSDGYQAIRLEGKNNDQRVKAHIKNNTFSRFTAPTGPISIHRDMPVLEKNTFVENVFTGIYIQHGQIREQYALESDQTYLVSGLTVEKLATLTVPAGVTLRLLPGTDITINGELVASGSESAPIVLMPNSTSWGALIFSGAKGTLSHVDISGGGLSQSIPSGQSRMIHAENSGIVFDSVHIHDSRIPGALIGADTSIIQISDSLLSWKELPIVSSWVTYGVYMDGAELIVKGIDFKNVVVPIYTSPGTVVKEGVKGEVIVPSV